jgi:hypothetical protein
MHGLKPVPFKADFIKGFLKLVPFESAIKQVKSARKQDVLQRSG